MVHDTFFDTVLVAVPNRAAAVQAEAKGRGINIWRVDADHVSVACDEATTAEHVALVLAAFGAKPAGNYSGPEIDSRTSEFSPTRLSPNTDRDRDDALSALAVGQGHRPDRSMIPLGSCTMKLNAAAEMESITWPEFGRQHPFAPPGDTPGLRKLIADLEGWLTGITGYDAIRCSPTPDRRASTPGCWPSAITTWRTATPDATCA